MKGAYILGFVMFFLISFTFGAMTERVFSSQIEISNSITGNVVNYQETIEETPKETVYSREKPSPQDWITESNIKVYNDRVVIELDNPEWARFTDTNSMDPVFDAESNAIEIVPSRPEQIKPGDIVSFAYGSDTVIHRVIKADYDKDGWYMITKGDNNNNPDPGKTRFDQVKRLVVAIIY